jgi:hypothetical protein
LGVGPTLNWETKQTTHHLLLLICIFLIQKTKQTLKLSLVLLRSNNNTFTFTFSTHFSSSTPTLHATQYSLSLGSEHKGKLYYSHLNLHLSCVPSLSALRVSSSKVLMHAEFSALKHLSNHFRVLAWNCRWRKLKLRAVIKLQFLHSIQISSYSNLRWVP